MKTNKVKNFEFIWQSLQTYTMAANFSFNFTNDY